MSVFLSNSTDVSEESVNYIFRVAGKAKQEAGVKRL
jgi:hypothetical protein